MLSLLLGALHESLFNLTLNTNGLGNNLSVLLFGLCHCLEGICICFGLDFSCLGLSIGDNCSLN